MMRIFGHEILFLTVDPSYSSNQNAYRSASFSWKCSRTGFPASLPTSLPVFHVTARSAVSPKTSWQFAIENPGIGAPLSADFVSRTCQTAPVNNMIIVNTFAIDPWQTLPAGRSGNRRCKNNHNRQPGLTLAAELIEQDWDRIVTFYNYPKKQWQHLRTTHPVESPFAGLRLRTDAAKRFKKVENAQAVIWKMLLVGEAIPPFEGTGTDERRLPAFQFLE